MLTVDEYGRIRRAHRDGMSIREIARQFHHSRYKVREILRGGGEPQKYRRRETQSFPKLAPPARLLPSISEGPLQKPTLAPLRAILQPMQVWGQGKPGSS